MRILVYAFAVLGGAGDEAGPLARAVAEDLAARIGAAEGVEAEFRPLVRVVDGAVRLADSDRRRSPDELRRFHARPSGPRCDFVVQGDLFPGDPYRLAVEVRPVADLDRTENFEQPADADGFAGSSAAARFVLQAIGAGEAPPSVNEFPCRRTETWRKLLLGREAATRIRSGFPGESAEAFEPLFSALAEEPNCEAAEMEISLLAIHGARTGSPPPAVCREAVERLRRIAPRSRHALRAEAYVKEAEGDLDGARSALQRAARLSTDPAAPRFEEGVLELRHRRPADAAAIFETLLADPTVGRAARVELGRARSALGDRAGAIEAWREAVRTAPEDGATWALLARELTLAGEFEEAEAALETGFALPEPAPALHLAAGLHYADQSLATRAIPHLEKALAAQPDPAVHLVLGRCLAMEGRKVTALHHLRKVLRSGGALADAARAAMEDFADADREARLVKALDDAMQRPLDEQAALVAAIAREEPSFAEAQIRRGMLRIVRRQPRRAIRCFRNALKLVPTDPDAWSGLAFAWHMRGRRQRALEALDHALTAAPIHPAIRALRDSLPG